MDSPNYDSARFDAHRDLARRHDFADEACDPGWAEHAEAGEHLAGSSIQFALARGYQFVDRIRFAFTRGHQFVGPIRFALALQFAGSG